MKKLLIVSLLAGVLSSCQKNSSFTVNSRAPLKVEFARRVLPQGYQIGAERPSRLRAVDLGLSVRWANMDVGACEESGSGLLFAWGSITPSSNFGWDLYEFNRQNPSDPSALNITRYCFDRYGEQQDLDGGGVLLDCYDDPSFLMWGEDFRMPSAGQLEELCESCTWMISGNICKAVGPNGGSISFTMPDGASGFSLWSSSLSSLSSPFAVGMTVVSNGDGPVKPVMSEANRCLGRNVRPVCD